MAVADESGADVELEASRVTYTGQRSTVVSVPIGVDYDRIRNFAVSPELPSEQQRLRELLGISNRIIGVGVDRLDYTTGIPEGLAALDEVMRGRQAWRRRSHLVSGCSRPIRRHRHRQPLFFLTIATMMQPNATSRMP